MKYHDKNREEIKAGMHLRMEDGTIEKVYSCYNDKGEADLGINASNEDYLRRQGLDVEINRECYPLYQFDLSKAEVCQPEFSQSQMNVQTM